MGGRRLQGRPARGLENRVHLQRQRDARGPRLHPPMDRLLQDRSEGDGRPPLSRARGRAAARPRRHPPGTRAGFLARDRDADRPGTQGRRRPAHPRGRHDRGRVAGNPVARHRISQGLQDDRPRRHAGGDVAARLRDRRARRAAIRIRRQPPGPSGTLGAHLLPRLRGSADRASRLRHQAAARRARRALSLLQPADSRRLVVALLLLLQSAAPSFTAETFDPLVMAGIRQRVYPGAALVIGTRDGILFAKAYGRFTWSPKSVVVSLDGTLWDLASLTKVVATTPALMLLVERGRIDLDSPVVRYVPEFNSAGTGAITVRHLLTHTSGLRGTLPLKDAPDSATALRMVLTTTPLVPPGTRMVYSDLNAILLGEIVRHVSGLPLDAFVTRAFYTPLSLDQQLLFRPPKRLEPRVAPTNLWHGHPIAGVVNDPSAGMLGGVSGNAGVFATARGLARFAQFMLNEGAPLLRRETVREFTKIAVPARHGVSARTLGWEALPTGEETSSAGTLLGPHSYGHTGWTGTSLWIDPDRDLFVLLLTNRAYDPRVRGSFTKLKEVRGRLADEAARAVDAIAH